jgi:hypothetical protein
VGRKRRGRERTSGPALGILGGRDAPWVDDDMPRCDDMPVRSVMWAWNARISLTGGPTFSADLLTPSSVAAQRSTSPRRDGVGTVSFKRLTLRSQIWAVARRIPRRLPQPSRRWPSGLERMWRAKPGVPPQHQHRLLRHLEARLSVARRVRCRPSFRPARWDTAELSSLVRGATAGTLHRRGLANVEGRWRRGKVVWQRGQR